MFWQVAQAVKITIKVIGSITNTKVDIDFLLGGATVVKVGTTNLIDQTVTLKLLEGIEAYMLRHGISDVSELMGGMMG